MDEWMRVMRGLRIPGREGVKMENAEWRAGLKES